MPKCETPGCCVYIQHGKRHCRKCRENMRMWKKCETEGCPASIRTSLANRYCSQCELIQRESFARQRKLEDAWWSELVAPIRERWYCSQFGCLVTVDNRGDYCPQHDSHHRNMVDAITSLNIALVKAHGTPLSSAQLSKLSMMDFIIEYAAKNDIRFTYIK